MNDGYLTVEPCAKAVSFLQGVEYDAARRDVPEKNGRVIGYDNAHDGHHRHYFGRVFPVEFVSFADAERRYEQEWLVFKKNRYRN